MFPTAVQVTYDVALYGQDGQRRASWSVGGRAPVQADLAPAVRAAMRDAAAAFIVGFREKKEVRAWLEGLGLVPSSARPPFLPGDHP